MPDIYRIVSFCCKVDGVNKASYLLENLQNVSQHDSMEVTIIAERENITRIPLCHLNDRIFDLQELHSDFMSFRMRLAQRRQRLQSRLFSPLQDQPPR